MIKGIKWTIVDNLDDTCIYVIPPRNMRTYDVTEQNNWILRVIEGKWITFFVVISRKGSSGNFRAYYTLHAKIKAKGAVQVHKMDTQCTDMDSSTQMDHGG